LLATVATAGAVHLFSQPGDTVPRRVRAHMEFLADDLLEGREAGTRGYELAVRYVSAALRSAGVEPAGDNGTFSQAITFRTSRLVNARIAMTPRGGQPSAFEPLEAAVLPNAEKAAEEITASVVYAGFGVTAPELQYDDYAGLDARGKIVVLLVNAPSRFPTESRAHYASSREKLSNAASHGAIGAVFVVQPTEEVRYPWSYLRSLSQGPEVVWLDAQGKPGDTVGLRGRAYLSAQGAQKLFANGPLTSDQIFAAATSDTPRGFELPVSLTIATGTEHNKMTSENVVGIVRGSDPALADSYVALTAHLDHTGMGAPINGDRIYNGAFDNALGSSLVIEVARMLAEAPRRPRRSILVGLVTAEEKGLLGSDFLAQHPPRGGRFVADLNLDMPLLQWPISEVAAFGAESSSLEAVVRRAAEEAGLRLVPDPLPQENLFVRSDQYSFVRQGVPSIYLFPAFGSRDPAKDGRQILSSFLATHYHRPSDDLSLPLDLSAVSAFARANYLIAAAIADDPDPPRWNDGNFFGERFGKP
jgi:Zn-dependent M28 family amino/carboxypeptidase